MSHSASHSVTNVGLETTPVANPGISGDKFDKVINEPEEGSDLSIDFSDSNAGPSDHELTPREWRWLKFKCYSFYMIMGAAYCIQYLDKACVAAGSVMGLKEDLNMVGGKYSWVNSAYFIGYLVGSIPFALVLLEKLGPKWNGFALLAWGIITTCSAGAQNYAGFIAIRTLLGLLESVCEPTITVMTSQWTHPDDQYAWILTWFAWNGWAQIFLQSVGYGLYTRQLKHEYSVAGWRILFIILGLMTILLAVTYIFFVPNSPQEARFLSDREKRAMKFSQFNQDNRRFKKRNIEWRQVWEAFITDFHHSFLLLVALICNSLNGGAINTFINLIIKALLINADHKLPSTEANKQSLLYGMIPGGIKLGVCVIIACLSMAGFMHRYRCFYALLFNALHVAAAGMLVYSKVDNVRLAGTYIYNTSVEVAHAAIISIIASNSNGYTKKIVVNGITLIGFSVGNIVGPQAFNGAQKILNSSADRAAIIALAAISFGALSLLFLTFFIENKIRDKKDEKLPEGVDPLDVTDRQNPEFRYHL